MICHNCSGLLLIFSFMIPVTVISFEYFDYDDINALATGNKSFPNTPMPTKTQEGPVVVNDTKFRIELVFKGLKFPTSMTFLGPNDLLVLEKNLGTVQRIVNGKMSSHPLLNVSVATQSERGMLGIATSEIPSKQGFVYVFLFYTQSMIGAKTGDDIAQGVQPLCNCLYRYKLNITSNKLVEPDLLLSLPANPMNLTSRQTDHNGGRILIGPDKNVYVTVGDVGGHRGQAQNEFNGPPLDGTSGILRVTQNGKPVPNAPLGNTFPKSLYYAYGIRNSFGIDFDPITGYLWDTENGPAYADEINRVDRGFNSGWDKVQGIWKPNLSTGLPGNKTIYPNSLIGFGGKGKYGPPEFTWYQRPFGPTAIKFFNSDKWGNNYKNDVFVGDIHNGYLYHFKLNERRDGFLFPQGPLVGKIAYWPQDPLLAVFAKGFGGITDLQIGPGDGYLYVLTLKGEIYKIVSNS